MNSSFRLREDVYSTAYVSMLRYQYVEMFDEDDEPAENDGDKNSEQEQNQEQN